MKWSKAKGGWVEGEPTPTPKTLEEHDKRWENIILNWEKKEPWKMFFPMQEIVRKFNKNGKVQGFRHMRLIGGKCNLIDTYPDALGRYPDAQTWLYTKVGPRCPIGPTNSLIDFIVNVYSVQLLPE